MAWNALIERERVRMMAHDYINLRNAQAADGLARNYHDELLAFAAGKGAEP